MSKLKPISLMVLTAIAQTAISDEDPTTSARYEQMRNEFLNITADYYTEAKGATIYEPGSVFGTKLVEKDDGVWALYGARHVCDNEYGDSSMCWLATGGSRGAWNTEPCGQMINAPYQDGEAYAKALANPDLTCSEKDVGWSGWEYWINAWDGYDYVADSFPKGNSIPYNRLCAEMEFDAANITATTDYIKADYKHSQIVNPEDIAPSLKYLSFGWGTYTAPKTSETRTGDEELGGTYQTGGSHFYHNGGYSNQQPMDRVYALDSDTVVACIGPNPNGVRGDARPTYAANPLLTVTGNDENGITNAYSYLNYLTRIYIKYGGQANVNYPWTLKVNKVWMMYEEDEIFAMGKRGSVLGLEMIENGQTAFHPFTLFNWAEEDRTYKAFMSASQTLPLDHKVDYYQLYIDVNHNKSVDSEDIEVAPYSEFTVPARTNMHFIIAHKPDFTNYYHSPSTRYGKHFAQSTVTFVEKGRMRSASYATRTWEGTPEEIANKDAFFAQTNYPAPDSLYATYAQYNQGYNTDTNPMLIRNYPDFKRALIEYDKNSPPTPPKDINLKATPDQ